jgi:hypothetical protein
MLLLAPALAVSPVSAATVNLATCDASELVQALNTANATPEADIINLPVGCTYSLQVADNEVSFIGNGLPVITSPVTINGNGSTIARDASAGPFRIFYVETTGGLELNGVTVAGGMASTPFFVPGFGGGIFNSGAVSLVDSAVLGCSAKDSGGGIANDIYGTLTVARSAFTGNSAGYAGGALYSYSPYGHVAVRDSTFSGNTATSLGGGLANLQSQDGTSVSGSTFQGNTADTGGALFTEFNATTTLTNSTFFDNHATSSGGGAYTNGILAATNVTISANSATGSGGGLFNTPYGSTTLLNTIVAGSPSGGNCAGAINDGGGNLQSGPESACGSSVPVGDPALGPLQSNGGPTPTMALLPGSAAIDAGTNAGCPATDQRGATRPQDGNGDLVAVCDSGSFEFAGPSVIEVAIDIVPGSRRNVVNPRSRGVVPVAILTDSTLNATRVDPHSVRFGPAGATACGPAQVRDVDGDGDRDLLLQFRIQDTGIALGDSQACLVGATRAGLPIRGCDAIRTVGH